MSYTGITSISTDHKVWLKSLDFYKDELRGMQKRLGEVATANTAVEVLQEVEHFQNQFIVQRNNIDELKHQFNRYSHELDNDMLYPVDTSETTLLEEKKRLRGKYEDFERVMNGLRHEFNKFLSETL
ncbi:MAG: hypothetical protein GC171_16950 [Terrimonas sp.]|nr:hypothetical protein [Terrimonas sp.]